MVSIVTIWVINISIVNPDANRLVLTDGKLFLVPTKPEKNLVLLQKTFSGDFVATVAVTMQLTQNNYVSLNYRIDERTTLVIGIAAANYQIVLLDSSAIEGTARRPFFSKWIEGQENKIEPGMRQLGNRGLEGYSKNPEKWYLQLQRVGFKYTGSVSMDGVCWTTIGTHVLVQKHGQLGLVAGVWGGGIENVAEFDDLVVQGSN